MGVWAPKVRRMTLNSRQTLGWPSGQANLPPVPPSRSAAQLHGRRNYAPAGDAQQPCQRWPTRPPHTTMRRAGELLRTQSILFDGSDPGRQTEALKGAVHMLPSRLEAGHERERWMKAW